MRCRVLGLSIGALAVLNACATSGSLGSSRLDESPTPAPEAYTHTLSSAEIDSVVAQALADQEGPRVDIRAQVYSTAANSRRLRGAFRVEDDAYVLIGHVDADGVVRIVFPQDPRDDGFVRGGRSYTTSEFFGGFEDAYRFRYATYGRYMGYQPSAYDGLSGRLFIVASWRPMHFDKFVSESGGWDSFEIVDSRYQDPRPAVQELAAMLAGENREAYTLKFATYSNSMNYGAMTGASRFGFGLATCSVGSIGWAPMMSWQIALPLIYSSARGDFFYYRGRPYVYDSLMGCAAPLPYGYYNTGFPTYTQPRIGRGQPAPGTPTGRTHMLGMEDSPRNPIDPRPTGGRVGPTATPRDLAPVEGLPVQVSQQYRQRGLITTDEPRAVPGVRSGRAAVDENGNGPRTRPSISEMTDRRTEGVRGTSRARYDDDANVRASRPDYPRSRVHDDDAGVRTSPREPVRGNGGNAETPRTYSRPTPQDSPRAVPQRAEPRMAEPRSIEPRVESRPTPPSTPPASEPASTSSGAPGKPVP